MKPILFGVSPVGLGHATRAVAIGMKLRERGVTVEFATGKLAAGFVGRYGFKVHDAIEEPTPFESGGKVVFSSLWYLRYWSQYKSSRRRVEKILGEMQPGLVVGDEEFASVSAAMDSGLESVLISDELELGFARSAVAERIERRVRDWYEDLQRRVPYLLVPDFGSDIRNIHYITPVVRAVTKTREQVLSEKALPVDRRVVLFSMSGSGIGDFLATRVLRAFRAAGPDVVLAIAGGKGKIRGEGIFDLGFVYDNQNLVAAADLVISLAGKSTTDEAMSSGTPIIAIPLKNHFEQERNAAAMGFSSSDAERLEALIPKYLGKRTDPKNYEGATKAADFIIDLAR